MTAVELGGGRADLVYLLGYISIFTVPFLVYLSLVVRGAVVLPPVDHGGAGRRLFGPLFIGFYYWFLGPLLRLASRTPVTPNAITAASLIVGAVTAVAIATGHLAVASALLVTSGTLDIVDGHVARSKKLVTSAGAFLDSTVDRVCDGLVFGGCVVYYVGTPIMYVALVALVMTFTISYARSRGETLGVTGTAGLMQRADRIVILSVAFAAAPFFGHRAEGFRPHPFYMVTAVALWLLAVLNTVTAIARISWIMRRLGGAERGANPKRVHPAAGDPVATASPRGRVGRLRPQLPPVA